ncbi:hypothetical protein [Komagataeibacter europaeus]|uniref:hypothetical protein n=1 Tax=Komagataeibacter TaxID=1434011 RepID=UPI0002D3A32B|nr:hypothetical protein [Komagataeibacter europaeus]GBQ39021.1 hypothetical protein AA18890_0330 [Komagataeibacter europaeus LMG 18890]
MPKRIKLPRGISFDFGRGFGLRLDRGSYFPSLSLFLTRIYALPDGLTGIVTHLIANRQALRLATDELERLRARCADCPHQCPPQDEEGDA